MKLGITMLIHNKDDIEFVPEFPCLLGHPVHKYAQIAEGGAQINIKTMNSILFFGVLFSLYVCTKSFRVYTRLWENILFKLKFEFKAVISVCLGDRWLRWNPLDRFASHFYWETCRWPPGMFFVWFKSSNFSGLTL